MINKNQTFQLSSEVLSQEIDGETVLLNMKTEDYFGLNSVGKCILDLIQSGASSDSIVNTLSKEYDIGKNQLKKDTDELLQQLLNTGIIKTIT